MCLRCAWVGHGATTTAAVTCVRRSTSGSSGGPIAAAAAAAARAAPVQQPICWPADGIACTAGPRAVAAACRALVTAGGGGAARASLGARWCRSAVTGDEPKVLSRVDRSPRASADEPPLRRRRLDCRNPYRRRRSPAPYIRRPKTADEDFGRSFFSILFFRSFFFFRTSFFAFSIHRNNIIAAK